MSDGLKRISINMVQKVISSLRQINIFNRLMISFVLLVIVPMIFITFFTFNQYVVEIETNMSKFTSLLVQNVNVQLTDKLKTMEELAIRLYTDSDVIQSLEQDQNLADSTEIINHNRKLVGQRMNTIARNSNYILSIQVITPNAQYMMVDEYGQRRGGYIRDRPSFISSPYYQGALEQHGYPVWFDTTKVTNLFYRNEIEAFGLADTMTMTQAIYGQDRSRPLGVIVMNIDIRLLTDSIRSYSFYGGGNTIVVGKTGAIMGVNFDTATPNLSTMDNMESIFQSQEGIYTGKIDGTNVILVHKLIPYTNLSVVHIVNKDQLLASAYKIRNLCLLVVFVLLLLSILIIYLTTTSISMPLQRLMKAMKSFTSKRFDVKVHVSGNDEITVLSEQFNRMVDNTKELIEQIYVADIRQKDLELRKANAELNALQMQINPHFLYNTMDIIRWEAMYEAGGESKVTHMIDDFCKLMRMNITGDEDAISVEQELQHAQTYIDVINFRHREKIQLDIDCSFDTKFYVIPKLTIQPLLENAVVHAFDGHTAGASITIKGETIDGDIFLSISDNGKGMNAEQLELLTYRLSGQKAICKGIALSNVHQRLLLNFGEPYGLRMESEVGSGTTIVIRIPLRTLPYLPERGIANAI